MPADLLAITVIVIALIFDYINGFHDAANSVATIVATRVLNPLQAVLWAAFFNFVAAFGFGTAVAKTVGSGWVDFHFVTLKVLLAGLFGAIVWNLLTWWLGLPSSSSHALMGGYIGAAMAAAGWQRGWVHSFEAIKVSGIIPTMAFIVIAPVLGLILAYLIMAVVYWAFRDSTPKKMDFYFRKLQLVSAAVFSFAHGTGDAQKTAGIITMVLFSAKYIPRFEVPLWVLYAAYAAIALGTLSGGWRIIHTMGTKLTRLKPRGGFAAETAAAISILASSSMGIPVSTTHVIAGAIAGVGSVHRVKAVRWGIARHIMWAWVLTIPASAVGWVSLMALVLATGGS
jgi:inorganic phosphate transporter, PiT family